VSLLFADDGVYQLVKGQDPSGIQMKNFSPTYRTLGDYGVRYMYVDRKSLEDRGLTEDDLMQVAWEDMESDDAVDNIVEVVDSAKAAEVLAGADVVFSF